MRKTKSLLLIGVVILLVAVLLVGGSCAKPPTPAAKVIKIGAPGPLSGLAAGWGLPEDRGLRMLVDNVNAAGGLTVGGQTYTFVVISADDKFTVEGAAAAANKLVTEDKVKYAIGGIDKHETLSLQSIFEPAGVIHFHDGWGGGIVHVEAPHSFRIPPSPQSFDPALHSYLLQIFPNAKRWSMVGYDTPGIRECNAEIEAYFKPLGLELVSEEYYAMDAVEFYPLIDKLIHSGVDAVEITGSTPAQTGLFVKQAYEKGYHGLIFYPAPLTAEDVVGIAGVQAAEGVMTLMTAATGDMATPEARAFYDAYVKSYGRWESNILDISVSFQIILDAMKKADSVEVEKVLPVLQGGGSFDTIFGQALIDAQEVYGTPNECFIPLALQVIRNGKLVPTKLFTAQEELDMLKKYLPK
jgi:branched-chain amino acid transport system substrate-binding protein